MPARKTPPLSSEDQAARDVAQLERFKEAARAIECDDDEQRFDERMKKLAKAQSSGDATVSLSKKRLINK